MASTSLSGPSSTHLGHRVAEAGRSTFMTLLTLVILAGFLSPLIRMSLLAFKTDEQVSAQGAPFWPALPRTWTYADKAYEIYQVPTDGGLRELALFKKGRNESQFLDPANPTADPIVWQGSWRTLDRAWEFAPAWTNFSDVWDKIEYPRLLFNTLALAALSLIGTMTSCIVVAYGFARFRIPGKDFLFMLLVGTVFLPGAVTLIPTYTIFVKLGWVGTWLPLIVPTFFANAYDVFLLRQFFLTIPREMDEAAMIDGAGPVRTLLSIILPQSWPAIIALSLFHVVYAWNDFFGPMIYLSTRPELQPISVGLQRFHGIYGSEPTLIAAGTLMTLVVPVLLFIFTQRYLMQGVVVTGSGVDK